MISSRGRLKSGPAAAARSCRRHASPSPAPPGGAGRGGAGPVITSANNATINIDGSGRDTLPGYIATLSLPPHISHQLLNIYVVTAPACIRTLETCSPRTICGVDLCCVKFVTNYSQRSTWRPSMLYYCSRGWGGDTLHSPSCYYRYKMVTARHINTDADQTYQFYYLQFREVQSSVMHIGFFYSCFFQSESILIFLFIILSKSISI